jgi:hypothetical protein
VEAETLPRARPQKYDPRPLEIVLGTSPGAGANFALTSPGRPGWRLVAVRCRLVCDAGAANRSVTVDYEDGNGTVFVSNGLVAVATANQTVDYTFAADRGADSSNVNFQMFAPLFPIEFDGGQNLQINVAGKQAGDQLSRIVLVFERQRYAPS